MKIKIFDCSCCGGSAPAFKQWYNQDDEYGICSECFKMHVEKYGKETAENYFGKAGIHHSVYSKENLSLILEKFLESLKPIFNN